MSDESLAAIWASYAFTLFFHKPIHETFIAENTIAIVNPYLLANLKVFAAN